MIEELVPAFVATADTFDDPVEGPHAHLHPREAAVVAHAAEKRQREFATVRMCARRALGTLGLPSIPLLPDGHGAPCWPDGVVGSMTHCDGYRAAAVARYGDVLSVGIDAEPNEPLPDGVLEVVSRPEERERLRDLAERSAKVRWDRLLFSAKEAAFKTWNPLTRCELGFDAAEITVEPDTGTFSARLPAPGPVIDGRRPAHFAGHWMCRNGLIVTAIVLLRTEVRA